MDKTLKRAANPQTGDLQWTALHVRADREKAAFDVRNVSGGAWPHEKVLLLGLGNMFCLKRGEINTSGRSTVRRKNIGKLRFLNYLIIFNIFKLWCHYAEEVKKGGGAGVELKFINIWGCKDPVFRWIFEQSIVILRIVMIFEVEEPPSHPSPAPAFATNLQLLSRIVNY